METQTTNTGNEGASKGTADVSVDINLNEKIKDDKVILDFNGGLDVNSFVQQQTESESITNKENLASGNGNGATNIPPTNENNKSVASELEKWNKEEKMMSEQFGIEDFEDLADMCIEVLDFIMLFVLRIFSLDNTDVPYKVPVEKLGRMKRILTKILMKMQMKFPLGFLFFVACVVVYGTPARKAWLNRKEIKAKEKALKEKLEAENPETIIKEAKIKNETIIKNIKDGVVIQQPIKKPQQQQPQNQNIHQEEIPKVKQEEVVPPLQKKTIVVNPMAIIGGGGEPAKKIVIPNNVTTNVPKIPKTGVKRGGHNK